MNDSVQIDEQVTDQPIANEAENQDEKYFTQADLDKIVKDRLDRERKKISKQFEGVDVEKYRQLMEAEEQQRLEQQKARGEFEKVLQETVSKKDTTIQKLQQELQSIKVDGSLLNAASTRRAVNPKQVVSLLKDNIRLGVTGDVEIVDNEGNIRYTDNGTAMGVDDLVEEFLSQNPHFISAGPNGSGSQSKIASTNGSQPGKIDISKLNMNDPADRELYRKYMKQKGIRF